MKNIFIEIYYFCDKIFTFTENIITFAVKKLFMNEIIDRISRYRYNKGLSYENMAEELNISPSAYRKIEAKETKLTVERLFKIAEILETKVSELLGLEIQKIYQQEFKDNSHNYQEIQSLHQENKEIYEKLIQAKDEQISLLKEQNKIIKEELQKSRE